MSLGLFFEVILGIASIFVIWFTCFVVYKMYRD